MSFLPWRRAIGRVVFTLRRYLHWCGHRAEFSTHRTSDKLSHILKTHQSLLLRPLQNVPMWLQHNKMHNLQLAIDRLDGLIIEPDRVFSFWYLVGFPSRARGFKVGMTLQNGKVKAGYGGGLCQLSNLIYWMALHTPLTVKERWHHSYDVFPDVNRKIPFGSGATVAYNYVDLQLLNQTSQPFQLKLWLSESHLHGEFRSNVPCPCEYEIIERNHQIRGPIGGRYTRHNELYRICRDRITQEQLDEECIVVNDALMMYAPLLPPTSFDRTERRAIES
ncbi:MAG: VanW family protein [Cyanobacteriota bacterium]|nr:VanW family protein [Cyanobacteriota bacterium]